MNSIFKFLIVSSNKNVNDESNDTIGQIKEKIKDLNDKNGPFDACIVVDTNIKQKKEDIKMDGLTIYHTNSSNSNRVIYFQKDIILLWNMEKNSAISLPEPPPSHIDILITNYWPCHLRPDKEGSLILTQLLSKIPVRYHFICGDDLFWERDPFDIPPSRNLAPFSICRVISLGNWNNPNQRCLYAFKLDPTSARIRPLHTTPNPYITESPDNFFFSLDRETKTKTYQELQDAALEESKRIEKMMHSAYGMSRKRSNTPSNPNYQCRKCHSNEHYFKDCPWLHVDKETYICHSCHQPGHHIKKCPKRKKTMNDGNHDDQENVGNVGCWFCLTNPAVKKHLIIKHGEDVYMALTKGPLHPYHVLIIPIKHQSIVSQDEQQDLNILHEMNSFHEKYFEMIKEEGYFMVSWSMMIQENSHHWHVQSIPLEMSKLEQFKSYLESRGFVSCKDDISKEKMQIELTIRESNEIIKYYSMDGNPQGGRRLLTQFLGKSELFDWRVSKLTLEDEVKLIEDIKSKIEK